MSTSYLHSCTIPGDDRRQEDIHGLLTCTLVWKTFCEDPSIRQRLQSEDGRCTRRLAECHTDVRHLPAVEVGHIDVHRHSSNLHGNSGDQHLVLLVLCQDLSVWRVLQTQAVAVGAPECRHCPQVLSSNANLRTIHGHIHLYRVGGSSCH